MHFRKKVHALPQNKGEFMQSVWEKHCVLEINLTQILYFGSQLQKKSENFVVCSETIACLCCQSERKKKKYTFSKSLVRNL